LAEALAKRHVAGPLEVSGRTYHLDPTTGQPFVASNGEASWISDPILAVQLVNAIAMQNVAEAIRALTDSNDRQTAEISRLRTSHRRYALLPLLAACIAAAAAIVPVVINNAHAHAAQSGTPQVEQNTGTSNTAVSDQTSPSVQTGGDVATSTAVSPDSQAQPTYIESSDGRSIPLIIDPCTCSSTNGSG